MEKVKFKQLTWPVKVGIIGGWILLAFYVLSFLIGFIQGILLAL